MAAGRIIAAVRKRKLTSVCLFLATILLLHGITGRRRNSAAPENNMEQTPHIRKHGRSIMEASTVAGGAHEEILRRSKEYGKYSYAGFDISTILKDDDNDGFDEFRRDPSKPYTLGPKISDWDEQRSEWLKRNPDKPNYIGENKPRVMLVTGSSPKPCENPVGDHYLMKSIKNKIDYCRLHRIQIYYSMALLDPEMNSFWAKLPLVRKLILTHPEVEFFWWMDSDAMFTDMGFEIPWEKYKDHNMVMHGWNADVYDLKRWVGLNAGVFIIRNCQWALDIFDALAPMGPKGKVRDEAGAVLTRELNERPVFEADDQSAMVYLLVKEREKWGEKVYLESEYFLHGYWEIVVDAYEELMENFHPGYGDHRWPLITHFVGCKPCGKFEENSSMGKCLKKMDRAFNFGDNQILQIYGFNHESLDDRIRVKRIRNESTNPLQESDAYGLRHPLFRAIPFDESSSSSS